jgi:DNA repair exonuclease SbcCD ATPase subunit
MNTTTKIVLASLVTAAPLVVASIVLYRNLSSTKADLVAARAQVSDLTQTVAVKAEENTQLVGKVETLDKHLKVINAEAEQLRTDLTSSKATLSETTLKLTELTERQAAVVKELEVAKAQASELRVQNANLSEMLSKADSELATSKKLISGLEAQLIAATQKLRDQQIAHETKVAELAGQITNLETTKTQLTTAVVTTKAELSAFKTDPDTRLLGAKVEQRRKSAVGENHAQQAIGIFGGIFDYFGNESMKSKEAKSGPQGKPFWCVVFRDGTVQEIAENEVANYRARIQRISTLWSEGKVEDPMFRPAAR